MDIYTYKYIYTSIYTYVYIYTYMVNRDLHRNTWATIDVEGCIYFYTHTHAPTHPPTHPPTHTLSLSGSLSHMHTFKYIVHLDSQGYRQFWEWRRHYEIGGKWKPGHKQRCSPRHNHSTWFQPSTSCGILMDMAPWVRDLLQKMKNWIIYENIRVLFTYMWIVYLVIWVIFMYVCMYSFTHIRENSIHHHTGLLFVRYNTSTRNMGWLRLVGSLKL